MIKAIIFDLCGTLLDSTQIASFGSSAGLRLSKYFSNFSPNTAPRDPYSFSDALYPEVKVTLEALKNRGYLLGLISNVGQNMIARLGIESYFDAKIYSRKLDFSKPDPRIFQEALNQLNVPAHRALMVGDSWEEDILGARSLGMNTLFLDRQKNHPEQHSIRNLHGLVTYLHRNPPIRRIRVHSFKHTSYKTMSERNSQGFLRKPL